MRCLRLEEKTSHYTVTDCLISTTFCLSSVSSNDFVVSSLCSSFSIAVPGRPECPLDRDKGRNHCSCRTPDEFSKLACAQVAGIGEADVVIVLLPGGRETYTEVGAALAFGKPIILYAPDRETLDKPYPCTFHYHPKVTVILSERLEPQQVLASIEH